MKSQGNIFLGSNLVLLTGVSFTQIVRDKITYVENAKIQENEIEATIPYIYREILNHLRMRYDKTTLKISPATASENEIESLKEFIVIGHHRKGKKLEDNPLFSSINTPNSGEMGKVYVYLYKHNITDEHPDNTKIELIDTYLRKRDPKIHIEYFQIDFPFSKIGMPPHNDKTVSYNLHHFSSRICGAFVEYQSKFKERAPERHCISGKGIISPHPLVEFIKEEDKINFKNKHLSTANTIKKILDIRDAVEIICSGLDGSMNYFPPVPIQFDDLFQGKNFDPSVQIRYKFPFGVWFRGQSRTCFKLKPSLFMEEDYSVIHQDCEKLNIEKIMYDESSMVRHFMLHQPEFRQEYKDIFEWLCLMQHYGAPSRVLDWTENILIALFFAVSDTEADCDGTLWVLNAGRLNEISRISKPRRYVCMPNSTDVLLRSALAVSRTGLDLMKTLKRQGCWEEIRDSIGSDKEFIDWINKEKPEKKCQESQVFKKMHYPVAVFPGRVNDRIARQFAAFTLHGGKSYDPEMEDKNIPTMARFNDPIELTELNQMACEDPSKGKQFLDVYIIPSCAKRKLREQLKRLGFHAASLFPELEYQAKYIKHQWRFEK